MACGKWKAKMKLTHEEKTTLQLISCYVFTIGNAIYPVNSETGEEDKRADFLAENLKSALTKILRHKNV